MSARTYPTENNTQCTESDDEGYDIMWKQINDEGNYEDTFPIKRYQSLLTPPDNNDQEKNDVTCLAVLHPHWYESEHENKNTLLLITGSEDKHARIWDFYQTTMIQYILCLEKVTAIATYTPKSLDNAKIGCKVIICGGSDDKAFALIWDPTTKSRRELFSLGSSHHVKYISSVIVHEPYDKSSSKFDKPVLFIGSTDRTVSIWELETENLLFKVLQEHTDLLLSIAIHDPGRGREGLHIITGSWDKTVLFFEWKTVKTQNPNPTQRQSYHRLLGHTKAVTAIAAYNLQGNSNANTDGNRYCSVLVTGSLDKTVILWDIETKEKVRTLRGHEQKITAVLIYESQFGGPPIVISGSEDGTSILWDLLSGEIIRKLTFPEKVLCQGIVSDPSGLIIVTGNPKARTIVTNLCGRERIRKYLTKAVTAIVTYTPRQSDPVKDPLVLIGTIDSSCTIFDMTTHKVVKTVQLHSRRINAAVIYTSPDPKQNPLVISCDGQAVVIVWDLFTYQPIKKMDGIHTGAVLCLGLYDPKKCAHIYNFDPTTLDNVVYHPNNPPLDLTKPILITGGTDKKLIFWDLLAPESTHRLRTIEPDHNGTHSEFIRSLVIHHPVTVHEEPLFITGSYDKTATVWNLRHYTKLYTLSKVHTDYVFFIGLYDPAAQFGRDQKKGVDHDYLNYPSLVTTSFDFSMAVWSLKPKKRISHQNSLPVPKVDATAHIQDNHPVEHEVNNPEKEHMNHSSDGISRLKYRKIGHRDSVTALTIFVPSNKEDNPLIITGSIDRTVIVWDLFTGSQLQKLIGHKDRVCYITTYLPADGKNPLVFSGSDDETTIVWEDSLHSKPFMPLRDDVNRCFDSDCLEEDWPLITELAKEYDSQLFLMNSNLFFLAVKYDRPDFLLKFRRFLTLVLPLIRNYYGQNLLSYAIRQNDLISVRIILLCWTENLNKDINDMLTQRMYHATYFFPDEALELLALKYPVEFKHFIISLRLIRNHYSLLLDTDAPLQESAFQQLHRDHHVDGNYRNHLLSQRNHHQNNNNKMKPMSNQMNDFLFMSSHMTPEEMKNSVTKKNNTRVLRLHPDQRYEVEATPDPVMKFDQLWQERFLTRTYASYFVKLWQEFIYETRVPEPVTSLMVPLRNTAKLNESLAVFVKVSNQLDSVDIFNSDVGMISLHYFWRWRARNFHIFAFVQYFIMQALFMTAIYVFEFFYLKGKLSPIAIQFVFILNGVVVAGFALYGVEECRQFYYEQVQSIQQQQQQLSTFTVFRAVLEHFLLNLWNFVDLVILCTAGIGIGLRFWHRDDVQVGRCLLAIGSVFMWFKFLYFLRPFSTAGPLVTMILEIAHSIRFYLLVLFCVLAGFTQAFWILSNIDPDLPWGTVKQGLLTSFFYMLSQNILQDMTGTISPDLATILIVCFMMIVIILMLNLLIALMSDRFAKVRAKGLAIWRKEQASIICEESFFFQESYVFAKISECIPYLHHFFFFLPKSSQEVPPYLHVLKYTSEVGNPEDENVSYKVSPLVQLVEQGRTSVIKFTDFPIKEEEEGGGAGGEQVQENKLRVIVDRFYDSIEKKKKTAKKTKD